MAFLITAIIRFSDVIASSYIRTIYFVYFHYPLIKYLQGDFCIISQFLYTKFSRKSDISHLCGDKPTNILVFIVNYYE